MGRASFLGRVTRASADTARISYSGVLAGIVQGAVLFFTIAIALNTLCLSFPFLTTAFAIVCGSIALAAAIAFNLWGREFAADMLARRELRMVFYQGDRLTTEDIDGTVESINPTLTLLQTLKGDLAVQNSDLMRQHAPRASGPLMGGDSIDRAAQEIPLAVNRHPAPAALPPGAGFALTVGGDSCYVDTKPP